MSPVRTTMADMITRLRRLIGDPTTPADTTSALSSPPPVWRDDQLQDWLDTRREVVRYAMLQPQPTPQAFTGIMQFLDYYATSAQWEADAQLFGPAWQPLTPATADFITGHWTFAASQIPTVWIVGKYYDCYATAADALEAWAGVLKLDFDFEAHLTRYMRSQKIKNCLALASQYRAKSEPQSIRVTRIDTAESLEPGYQWAGIAGSID